MVKTKQRDMVGELLAIAAEVKLAATEADSDLVRTHLNNIYGAIVGLDEALGQISAWERPE